MVGRSECRGRAIEYKNDEWVYSDDKEINMNRRAHDKCLRCLECPTEEGHDSCLGVLKGLMNACCGHGDDNAAYVQFWGGHCVRGSDAITIINILKKHK